ncbi:diacylglycerol O-acyltransferase 1 isoform X1 [Phymastichus coffea]|uniref:diacylglycerol O-acyltransferase 1 isoform X1 n=1 Tax=Phymastichus coffea TaxID=108790 RepID=UPI00273B135A|nr:diacylglycerol O-acyltransferase 1 isoform X1 [Phymastichus coffea]XP_058802653.1 diacylglycerol O-acyltransferase 1 isoform X1 [Phymastichus coffea]
MKGNGEHESGMRLRRTKSVTRAEEIQKAEQMARRSQPDKPCHRPRDSLFSWSSGFDNFTGFVNWGFLLLGIGGIRLLLENFIKYGIRVDPRQWLFFLVGKNDGNQEHPSILLICYSTVPISLCLLIEKGLAMDLIAHGPGMVFHVVNLIVMVLMPMVVIHVKESGFSLVGAMYVCMLYAILFLKLWSYVQVNTWCRLSAKSKNCSLGRMRRQSLSYTDLHATEVKQNGCDSDETRHKIDDDVAGKALVQYPDNLNLSDLYYYILAPTLCYELNFPRTTRIRKRFLIKRILEVVVGCQVVMSLFQQWMIPSVKNSLIPFSNMDVAKASERLLKLAIPNHLMWLCFFYLSFHSYLNLMGEMLHFADRNFYCDWWNANNIDTFWRTWNMPVHRWAVRHLYIPVVEMGYSKTVASVTVFFISAFFHEYLVSVPLKTFKIWAFMGMMGQIPLSVLSKHVERNWGARWGNIVVWASLIIGQPLCIMMYYHDYVVTHYGETLLEDYSHV